MKRYPMIGGPLDGREACMKDFDRGFESRIDARHDRPPGAFLDYRPDYFQFNRGDRGADVPTMIWVHKSLLPGGMLSSYDRQQRSR